MATSGTSAGAKAIFWGGLACGVLDISQAFLAWGLLMKIPPYRILQSVAGGALGQASFQMGWRSAVLGLGFHFLIAFGAATVYWVASQRIHFMIRHVLVSGMIYGECVYVFMNFVVVPLSALHRFPIFSLAHILTGPIGHTILVGLPIALIARRYSAKAGRSGDVVPL
jgi:hypothetical protein